MPCAWEETRMLQACFAFEVWQPEVDAKRDKQGKSKMRDLPHNIRQHQLRHMQ